MGSRNHLSHILDAGQLSLQMGAKPREQPQGWALAQVRISLPVVRWGLVETPGNQRGPVFQGFQGSPSVSERSLLSLHHPSTLRGCLVRDLVTEERKCWAWSQPARPACLQMLGGLYSLFSLFWAFVSLSNCSDAASQRAVIWIKINDNQFQIREKYFANCCVF